MSEDNIGAAAEVEREKGHDTVKDAGFHADVYWCMLHMLTYADVC
jgi:hypothetical protein